MVVGFHPWSAVRDLAVSLIVGGLNMLLPKNGDGNPEVLLELPTTENSLATLFRDLFAILAGDVSLSAYLE